MKYPVSIQTFEQLITGNYLYIDKTEYIYNLANKGKYYFLSRPRRFGKSLLLSTLSAYFKGKKELFKGLKIGALEKKWESYPVFHIELNARNYKDENSLTAELNKYVGLWEKDLGIDNSDKEPEERFFLVLKESYDQTGKRAVILIDEYDNPLISVVNNKSLQDSYRNILKAFFSVLKSQDAVTHFAMITGVTRFSKLSIFSDLNSPQDISMDSRYQAVCGITEAELDQYCCNAIKNMSEKKGMSYDDMRELLKKKYDGYHFVEHGVGIYNPYSLINAFDTGNLDSYWYGTGTPTFLVELIKKTRLTLDQLTGGIVTRAELKGNENFEDNPLPIMFQSGYLTISDYNEMFDEFTLDFPNEEVRKGFLDSLIPTYLTCRVDGVLQRFNISGFVKDVLGGKPDMFMQRLVALYANMDYQIVGDAELYFHNSLSLIFMLLGFYVRVERHTSNGRMDIEVETPDNVYIFECKIDKSVEEALEQIDEKGYAVPFSTSGKKIFKIGVNFSTKTRCIEKYLIEG